MLQGWYVGIENIDVEREAAACREMPSVERGGTQDKRPRPVREATGSAPIGQNPGLEHSRIRAVPRMWARFGVFAVGSAGDMPEDLSERAPEDVGGLARAERDRIQRLEVETQWTNAQNHVVISPR